MNVYRLPYDPRFPVFCMDESGKQLIGEVHAPIPTKPGQVAIADHEYVRQGVTMLFVRLNRWPVSAMSKSPNAAHDRIGLTLSRECSNNATPKPSRCDWSWTTSTQISAWQNHRNNRGAPINWRFTTEDARVKLLRLYSKL